MYIFTYICMYTCRAGSPPPQNALRFQGPQIARQTSTPRKSSWISSGNVQWTFGGIFRRKYTFVISGV